MGKLTKLRMRAFVEGETIDGRLAIVDEEARPVGELVPCRVVVDRDPDNPGGLRCRFVEPPAPWTLHMPIGEAREGAGFGVFQAEAEPILWGYAPHRVVAGDSLMFPADSHYVQRPPAGGGDGDGD